MNRIYLCIIAVFTGICCQFKTDPGSYIQEISNEGLTKTKPYLTAGDKAYIIGTQDGLFPDMGSHVRGEMGGIWTHPVKLADGYWARISDESMPDGVWLMEADEYITYPHGSGFLYKNTLNDLQVRRFQFVPDQERGVIIEYALRNSSAKSRDIILDFVLKTDLSPVWLSRENGIPDYPDLLVWDSEHQLFTARDSVQSWHMAWGTDHNVLSYEEDFEGPEATRGQGKSGCLRTSVRVAPGEEKVITFAISGSTNSETEAKALNNRLLKQKKALMAKKQESFGDLIARSKLTLPDKQLETVYNWIKINTRWLEMDLEGYGRFLGAGAIEYPWLFGCDNSYSIQGVLAYGDFELAKSTLTILKNVSDKKNGNGRIIHEMSTNGIVYNPGNTQETAHYIVAVWKAFLWTGDLAFLQDIYPYIKKGLHWLTVEMDKNQNLFPEGYGIMEVSGLNAELIDVAVYTQQALEAASEMAALMNEQSMSDEYASKATLLKEKINVAFWDENEGIYCDFFGTKEQAISVANGAIRQLRQGNDDNIRFYESLIAHFNTLPDSTQRGWFTNKNWVINTPMETAIAPVDKAVHSLDKIRNEHCGEYGPYLSAVEKMRMMTIATGVQAVSEAQYGRMNECLWYMNKITATLSRTLPGSINEMMPDYGCPVQAWTIYGISVPLVMHIFGINPDAYHKKVIISPTLPASWNGMSLENQRVGSNSYDIQVNKTDGKITYTITSKEKGWTNLLRIKGLAGKSFELNGKTIHATSDDIELTGTKNTIRY